MSPIRNNPYRKLGVLANSTEKELQKQIAIIKRFAEVGKTKSFDFDFPFLGDFSREFSSVQDAASKIEQAKNRLYYGLFWFVNNGNIDEIALSHLKENNVDKAREIWNKLLKTNNLNNKNISAYANLSTLNLGIITSNGSFDPGEFQFAIKLKGLMLTSDNFPHFAKAIGGQEMVVDRDQVIKEFIDEVLVLLKPYLDKSNGLTTLQLFEAFSAYPEDIKKYLSGKFTDNPVANIENKIEETKDIRTEHPEAAGKYGKELYEETLNDLYFLASVWGRENVQYQRIVNKVSQEILQCAIDFFVAYRDSDDYDPDETTMMIMNMANNIGPTGQVKSRVDENIENLNEWIEAKPERERNAKIQANIDFIVEKINKFQDLSATIENASALALECKPKIKNIKYVLGSNDEFYVEISSAVVRNTQGMLISVVNGALKPINSSTTPASLLKINITKGVIDKALEVTGYLVEFDMDDELMQSFADNRKTLFNLQGQFAQAVETKTSNSQDSSQSSSGCYLATMVYGSYDHPKVLILRKYRDERLLRSPVGRKVVAIYYNCSPYVVKKLKGKELINVTIRHCLNLLIKVIK
ncbi:CFI-box-CTERM domain-containing protein [Thermodesulfobacteriota bacterium]